MDDTFQAKLGWLVGQMYSRVGTRDWEKSAIRAHIEDTLRETAYWVDDRRLKKIKNTVKKWQNANPGTNLDEDTFAKLVSSIKSKKQEVLEAVETALRQAGPVKNLVAEGKLSDEDFGKIMQKLEFDSSLTSLLQ